MRLLRTEHNVGTRVFCGFTGEHAIVISDIVPLLECQRLHLEERNQNELAGDCPRNESVGSWAHLPVDISESEDREPPTARDLQRDTSLPLDDLSPWGFLHKKTKLSEAQPMETVISSRAR